MAYDATNNNSLQLSGSNNNVHLRGKIMLMLI